MEMDGRQWLRCCWHWRCARPHQLNRWRDEEGDNVASVWLKTNEAVAVIDIVWTKISIATLYWWCFFHFLESSVELRKHRKKWFFLSITICFLHRAGCPSLLSRRGGILAWLMFTMSIRVLWQCWLDLHKHTLQPNCCFIGKLLYRNVKR